MIPTRRHFLMTGTASTIALSCPASLFAADAPLEIEWSDLIPGGDGGTELDRLRSLGVVQHGEMSSPFDQASGGAVTEDYNGKLVRIPGYMIPLDFEGLAMTAGLLVPYVGACIHVPPPPANQLIFVTTERPYESEGLFEPVWVTGEFGTSATETQLAEVGYAMHADKITPYS